MRFREVEKLGHSVRPSLSISGRGHSLQTALLTFQETRQGKIPANFMWTAVTLQSYNDLPGFQWAFGMGMAAQPLYTFWARSKEENRVWACVSPWRHL